MQILSVIEISSTAVEMIICQKTAEGIEILEKIEEELNLLKGVRKSKKISFEKGQKLCDILKKMKKLSNDYNIEKIITITSSSLSNIENLPFLLNQITLQVDLQVIVPKAYEKKKLRFKKFLQFENEMVGKRGNTLFLNINSSTSDLLLFNNGKLLFSETLSTGMHSLLDILDEENLNPEEVYTFLEEYITDYLVEFKKGINRRSISTLSFIGGMRSQVFHKFFGDTEIKSTSFQELFHNLDKIKELSFNEMSTRYDLSTFQVILLFINTSLLNIICNFFQIKSIKTLSYDAKEIIAQEFFYPEKKDIMENQIWKLTLDSAKDLGMKYSVNKEHANFTLKAAKMFYKALIPYHAMERKFEQYLELAALLHDIGKGVSLKEQHRHSEYLVKNSFIFGVTEEQLDAVSFLVAANNLESYIDDFKTRGIPNTEFVNFLKLAAILKISTALDRSKKQKVSNMCLGMEDNTLVVNVDTGENFLVEKHSFNEQIEFFKKVFGLNTRLNLNRRYHGNEI